MSARELVIGAELTEDADHRATDQVAAIRVGLIGDRPLERVERGFVIALVPGSEGAAQRL